MCDFIYRRKTIPEMLREHLSGNNKKLTNTKQTQKKSTIVNKK